MARRVVICSLLILVCGCGIKDRKNRGGMPKTMALSEFPIVFDGRPRTGWDATNFGPQGPVTVSGEEIVLGMGDGCTGITWREEFPTENYLVELDARRVEGNDFFCGMTFPAGKSPCSLIIGGWGGTTVGLSSIDGEDAFHNSTRKSISFEKNRWYHIRLSVTPEKLRAWIDTTNVVDFAIANHRLSIRPEVELSRPFGIASWNTTAGIRRVQVLSAGQ